MDELIRYSICNRLSLLKHSMLLLKRDLSSKFVYPLYNRHLQEIPSLNMKNYIILMYNIIMILFKNYRHLNARMQVLHQI